MSNEIENCTIMIINTEIMIFNIKLVCIFIFKLKKREIRLKLKFTFLNFFVVIFARVTLAETKVRKKRAKNVCKNLSPAAQIFV